MSNTEEARQRSERIIEHVWIAVFDQALANCATSESAIKQAYAAVKQLREIHAAKVAEELAAVEVGK